jgi:hypothetical protein
MAFRDFSGEQLERDCEMDGSNARDGKLGRSDPERLKATADDVGLLKK